MSHLLRPCTGGTTVWRSDWHAAPCVTCIWPKTRHKLGLWLGTFCCHTALQLTHRRLNHFQAVATNSFPLTLARDRKLRLFPAPCCKYATSSVFPSSLTNRDTSFHCRSETSPPIRYHSSLRMITSSGEAIGTLKSWTLLSVPSCAREIVCRSKCLSRLMKTSTLNDVGK